MLTTIDIEGHRLTSNIIYPPIMNMWLQSLFVSLWFRNPSRIKVTRTDLSQGKWDI